MAKRYYPTPDALDAVPKDQPVLFEVQRSFWSIFSILGLPLVFFTLLVVIANIWFADVRLAHETPILRHVSVRWLALIPAVLLVEMLRRYHNDLYIFARHRATHLEGRLALNYSVPVIKYSDVRGIRVEKDIPGRIFNYGDVQLGTAAHDGTEMKIGGVRAPYELADLLDRLRCRSRDLMAQQETSPEFAKRLREEEALEEELQKVAEARRGAL